ncbi:hypothetical protein MCC93_05780 [Morococcus cerebrosus]|uniref:Uncharacterized protein n=1 Tax=Morococcus cerebrosus TaxID=1056807 RepID=A0A0C1H9X5_9NEIS|nr:hypothetical protein MCC93_05780 [Morococcus cerebrosus]
MNPLLHGYCYQWKLIALPKQWHQDRWQPPELYLSPSLSNQWQGSVL